MSEIKAEPQTSQILEEAQELRKKKFELDKYRIESNHDEMVKRKEELATNDQINLNYMSLERLDKIKRENREYLEHARNASVFINNDFKCKVPFFGRNLILVGAQTGHGKTTIGKNIAFQTLAQGGRALYLTNEENSGDVYNGITCLCRGWPYTTHESFTEEQMDEFDKMIGVLSQRLVVIDDNYNEGYGQTTTLEGIKAILTNLHKANIHYDVIIIDYYQNVSRSNEQIGLSNWQVQEELAKFLDSFKNTYLAPIVVLSQLKSNKDLPFKEAIEGRKMILNVATCAMEVSAEREFMRTAFTIHKSRFNYAMGDVIHVGFDKGKYVQYTSEFKNNNELDRARKDQTSLLSRVLGGQDD